MKLSGEEVHVVLDRAMVAQGSQKEVLGAIKQQLAIGWFQVDAEDATATAVVENEEQKLIDEEEKSKKIDASEIRVLVDG